MLYRPNTLGKSRGNRNEKKENTRKKAELCFMKTNDNVSSTDRSKLTWPFTPKVKKEVFCLFVCWCVWSISSISIGLLQMEVCHKLSWSVGSTITHLIISWWWWFVWFQFSSITNSAAMSGLLGPHVVYVALLREARRWRGQECRVVLQSWLHYCVPLSSSVNCSRPQFLDRNSNNLLELQWWW